MVQGNITRLETKLVKLEYKETLTKKEQQTVSKMVKKLEVLSAEFKTYQCAIVDQIEDQNKLTEEQTVLDNNEDKVEDLMDCLVDLVKTTETVTLSKFSVSTFDRKVRSWKSFWEQFDATIYSKTGLK